MPFAEPGLYEILVSARQGVAPERVVTAMQDELDGLASGLSPDEEDKARASLELSFFDGFKSAIGIAEALGHHEAALGDFTQAFAGYELMQRTSSADLARVAAQVFGAHNRTAIIAVPGRGDG
jgi:predicted Zn-dependent peptidase